MQEKRQGDLVVMVRARDLMEYVFTVTHKSPKEFRYSIVGKLQNLSISVMENLFRANDVYVREGRDGREKYLQRLDFQQQALTDLRLLAYFAELGMGQKVILRKQRAT